MRFFPAELDKFNEPKSHKATPARARTAKKTQIDPITREYTSIGDLPRPGSRYFTDDDLDRFEITGTLPSPLEAVKRHVQAGTCRPDEREWFERMVEVLLNEAHETRASRMRLVKELTPLELHIPRPYAHDPVVKVPSGEEMEALMKLTDFIRKGNRSDGSF